MACNRSRWMCAIGSSILRIKVAPAITLVARVSTDISAHWRGRRYGRSATRLRAAAASFFDWLLPCFLPLAQRRGLRANVECLGGKPARAILVSSPMLTIRNAADQLEIADTPLQPQPCALTNANQISRYGLKPRNPASARITATPLNWRLFQQVSYKTHQSQDSTECFRMANAIQQRNGAYRLGAL
ncbi:MAG: hypothetical protein RugAbin2_02350 [Rugosibacter sp.]|jgi:hypothetical protein|nr:hypothetical protein [Rugosibacter sp.]